jgi:hypothetical protein
VAREGPVQFMVEILNFFFKFFFEYLNFWIFELFDSFHITQILMSKYIPVVLFLDRSPIIALLHP